jgi:hypothetical protein
MILAGWTKDMQGNYHFKDVYHLNNKAIVRVIETRDKDAWADITRAATNVRLTLTQLFDPGGNRSL